MLGKKRRERVLPTGYLGLKVIFKKRRIPALLTSFSLRNTTTALECLVDVKSKR